MKRESGTILVKLKSEGQRREVWENKKKLRSSQILRRRGFNVGGEEDEMEVRGDSERGGEERK